MKKIKPFVMALFLGVIFPLAVLLTSCGVNLSSEVKGVSFVSNVYDDETGYAVFEVDLNEPTMLEYKVYPSSWSSEVRFSTIDFNGLDNTELFERTEDGVVTVYSSDFREIVVEIIVGEYRDRCIVRLKEYPTEIYVEETDVTINAMGSYTVHVFGVFETSDGGTETRELKEDEFNFLVSSSDEQVINVDNSSRLKINSVREKSGTAEVTISLLNVAKSSVKLSTGGDEITTTLTVTTVERVNEAFFLTNKTSELFLLSDSEAVINIYASQFTEGTDLTITDDVYVFEISYEYYLVSENNTFLNNGYTHSCSSTNRSITFDEENQKMYISFSSSLVLDTSFDIYICFDLLQSTGSPFVIKFTINFINDL